MQNPQIKIYAKARRRDSITACNKLLMEKIKGITEIKSFKNEKIGYFSRGFWLTSQ